MAGQLFHSITDAAQLVGVSSATLRLWEKEGLVRPARNAGGHRQYSQSDLLRLRRIQHLRSVQKLNIAAIRRELAAELSSPVEPAGQTDGADMALSAGSTSPAEGKGTGGQTGSENQLEMGRKLRVLRLQHGLTLEQASQQAGLSVSFISAVERGSTGISLASLLKLTLVYNVLLQDLYREAAPGRTKLVKADARQAFEPSGTGVRIEQLTHGPAQMEAQCFTLEPGASSEGAYAHQGEEMIYVLEGSAEFFLDENEHYHVEAGDCLYFSSSQFHRWENQSNQQTRLLWVNTTPTLYPSTGV